MRVAARGPRALPSGWSDAVLGLASLLTLALALAASAGAAPDLRTGRAAGPLTLYADDARPGLFYYPPGEVNVATGADGRPDVHFLQMRYTGSAVSADRGVVIYRSILSFRVRLARPGEAELRAARSAVGAAVGHDVELRPLPIQKLEAALVYTSLGSSGGASDEQALPGGHFEESEATATVANAYWSERIFTLALDPNTSQIFWDALQKGQVVLSLGYAFYASGVPPSADLAQLTGSPALIAELRRRLGEGEAESASERAGKREITLVRAGATAITMDAKAWPALFRRVDINETVPPGYAALDVYCYDFNNELRPDLYQKEVEIAAEGMGRRGVTMTAAFRRDQPDLYARSLRFPFAVRLDRPYRYRVTELRDDGSERVSPWQERASWVEILDITSPPEERPTPTPEWTEEE